jgi:hypothetical protein
MVSLKDLNSPNQSSKLLSTLGFTPEQYQKLLALISSADNKDAHVNLTPVQQLHSSSLLLVISFLKIGS